MEQEKRTVEMTPAEWEEYQKLKAEAERKAAAEAERAEREEYRRLAEDSVDEAFVEIKKANEMMRTTKELVMDRFATLMEMRTSYLGASGKTQGQFSFVNRDLTRRIIIGRYKKLSHDATSDVGIAKVKDYLETLGKDEHSQKLVGIILELLSGDDQGKLDADKILQLERYALQFDSPDFTKGVEIIKEALIFDWTKHFFRAEEKDESGAWKNIPLSMINI